METIIKISTLYGISFLIAMFVAFVIWALYEVMGNPKFFSRLTGGDRKSNAISETNEKV